MGLSVCASVMNFLNCYKMADNGWILEFKVGPEQGRKINIVPRFMVFDLDHAVTIHNPSCYQTMNLMLCLYSRSGSVFLDMEVATMI